jgi:GAF domain-containing protein
MFAARHPQETSRLASLKSYGILDTPREARYDRIVYTAAQMLRAPIAMISFVDADRQWFKSVVGIALRESGLESGFCPFAILEKEILVVEDTHLDLRFATNPVVVGAPFVRFYAGVPLLCANGLPIGTLCVADTKPRQITPGQIGNLKALARETEQLL